MTCDDNLKYKDNHIRQYVLGPVFKTFIVYNENKIIASAVIQIWDIAKYAYGENIIVKKEYRNQGVACFLIDYIEKLLKKKEIG